MVGGARLTLLQKPGHECAVRFLHASERVWEMKDGDGGGGGRREEGEGGEGGGGAKF